MSYPEEEKLRLSEQDSTILVNMVTDMISKHPDKLFSYVLHPNCIEVFIIPPKIAGKHEKGSGV